MCTHRAGEHAIKVREMILWGGAGIASTDASLAQFWSPWNSGDSIDHRFSVRQASSPGLTAP